MHVTHLLISSHSISPEIAHQLNAILELEGPPSVDNPHPHCQVLRQSKNLNLSIRKIRFRLDGLLRDRFDGRNRQQRHSDFYRAIILLLLGTEPSIYLGIILQVIRATGQHDADLATKVSETSNFPDK